MSSIGIALSYDMKAQIARDLALEAPTIDEQTALVDSLPLTVLQNYISVNISKTHSLFVVQGHNILISNATIDMFKKYVGYDLGQENVEQATYIGYGDTDLTECTLTDTELSRRAEYSLNVEIEGRRNELF